jgi:hypothetical protein
MIVVVVTVPVMGLSCKKKGPAHPDVFRTKILKFHCNLITFRELRKLAARLPTSAQFEFILLGPSAVSVG